MFDFYRIFFNMGYLAEADIYEAATWGVITLQEYEQITGQPYVTQQ